LGNYKENSNHDFGPIRDVRSKVQQPNVIDTTTHSDNIE
jgi:hypothetical protein